ncbi:MAG: hypothetical protein ACFCUI_04280 [Bernardetiaceae bacterium]
MQSTTKNIFLVILFAIVLLLGISLFFADQQRRHIEATQASLSRVLDDLRDSLGYYKQFDALQVAILTQDHQTAQAQIQLLDQALENPRWQPLIQQYLKNLQNMDSAYAATAQRNQLWVRENLSLRSSVEETTQERAELMDSLKKMKSYLSQVETVLEEQKKCNKDLEKQIQEVRNSTGRLTFSNSEGIEITYFGETQNGQANGYGIAIIANKGTYVGTWKDNLRHGSGKYRWHNGHVYVGDFAHGKRNGTGTYTFDTGEKYIGGWKDDLRHGHGALYTKDGTLIVRGDWKEDKFEKGSDKKYKQER